MRAPLLCIAVGLWAAIWAGSQAAAGPINFTSAELRADVSVDAITVDGGPFVHNEGHDTGDLTRRTASTQAVAALPFAGLDYPVTRGNAKASAELGDASIRLDGSADSIVFVKSTPFSGVGRSASQGTVRFTVTTAGPYDLSYDATLAATDPTPSSRTDVQVALRSQNESGGGTIALIDLASRIGGEPQSGTRQVDLALGDYSLDVTGEASSDLLGKLGEGASGNISYQVSLAPSAGNGGVSIPLPPALMPGLLVLTAAVIIVRRRGRRIITY